MSVSRKIALAAVIYIGYQLLTNKKYDGLRSDILKEYDKVKPSFISTLDDVHTYLTIPKDVGDESIRMRIDTEIKLLKEKIKKIDTTKAAEKTNKIISTVSDVVSESFTKFKKKK
ncbi:MAG: hypothetical protein LBD63_02970 [Mycoplasmataceae bacterium]|jgi:transposase-like protein|nr:hypothetical protein [Mycoplasmataceae bacterium]